MPFGSSRISSFRRFFSPLPFVSAMSLCTKTPRRTSFSSARSTSLRSKRKNHYLNPFSGAIDAVDQRLYSALRLDNKFKV
jgi:hypothetical protein